MSVHYKANMIYDAAVENITKSEDVWKDICRMAGQLYRYEFQNILLIYEQRPGATLVADYDTWKKVDRYVRRGSKGIAILPSRALQPSIRYVFDIGDTGGKKQRLTWDLEGNRLADYLSYEGVAIPAEADRVLQLNLLKVFTKRQIRSIIKEDFAERMTQLNMLAGRVLTDHDEETSELTVQRLVTDSILYAVGTRCGFSLSSEEQDLSLIVNISGEDNIYALGSLVCDVSCTVLRGINQSLTQMKREKYERTPVHSYGNPEQRENGGHYGISNQLSQRRTWDAVPRHRSGAGEAPAGEIRHHGDGISGAEPQGAFPDVKDDGQTERSVTAGGGGSEPASGSNGKSLSEKAPAEAERFHDGDVENQRAGTEDSGRNRDGGSNQQIPLKEPTKAKDSVPEEAKEEIWEQEIEKTPVDEAVREELNKELDELNSLGMEQREAEYHQASLFDYMEPAEAGEPAGQKEPKSFMDQLNEEIAKTEAQGKYHYLNPKKEKMIPHEYVVQTLMRGSGYENGKQRIYEIFQNVSEPKERAKQIKKEYGSGGASWPMEGYGLHGYDTFHSNGIRLDWRDEEGAKEGYLSWKTVEAEIGALILTGQYYTPHVSMDELLDADREDIIDGEYREIEEAKPELTDDEIEEILEADRQLADERYERQQEKVLQGSHPHSVSDIDFEYIDAPNDKKITDGLGGQVRKKGQTGRRVRQSEKPELEEKLLSRYSIQKDISESNEPMFQVYDKKEQKLYQDAYGEIPRFRTLEKADYYLHYAVWKRMFPQEQPTVVLDDDILQDGKVSNYHISTLSAESAGAKTRFQWNVDAIRTLKEIENAGRNATPKEQEILAKYVGWGGIAQAFDEANDSWSKEYKQLKELLTESEYRAARETVMNAFYTPPEVTSAIYAALAKFGFRQGNILEPSAGIGNRENGEMMGGFL